MHVTMSQLGQHGRFGNQLFQYAFLRIYARRHGLQLQTAPWVGEDMFGIPPSPVTVELPPWTERVDEDRQPFTNPPPPGRELCGRDFRGYAQYHTNFYAPHRKFIRKLYRPADHLYERMAGPVRRLREMGDTIIGIHLRRGDYGRLEFYVTPTDWYHGWLAENWARFKNPVLFIATETPGLVDEFAYAFPVTTDKLGVDLKQDPLPHYPYLAYDKRVREPWQMDFFPDWYLLSQCDVLVTPNSSFSFTAGMVSDNLKEFWRSSLPLGAFEKLGIWNTVPLTHDRAEDYRHLPGVCLDKTAYWERLPDGTFREAA